MRMLYTSIALMALFCAGTAVSAAPDKTGDSQTPRGERVKYDGPRRDKPKAPSFDECDSNKNGVLTLDEFLVCHSNSKRKENRKEWIEKSFAAMDSNKDGKVTEEEMDTWRAARKAERETRMKARKAEMFNRCDTNNDGMLSLDEFQTCRPEPKAPRDGKGPRDGKQPKKATS